MELYPNNRDKLLGINCLFVSFKLGRINKMVVLLKNKILLTKYEMSKLLQDYDSQDEDPDLSV